MKSDEFELSNSIRITRSQFPNCTICLVGDKPKTVVLDRYFAHKQTGNCKAARTSGSIIHGVEQLQSLGVSEFVLMSDDEFIFSNYKFHPKNKGLLISRRTNNAYQQAETNTYDWLKFRGMALMNYECHQPCLINADWLLKVMSLIDTSHPHLIKSIYFNTRENSSVLIENLKTASVQKAKQLRIDHGAFSTISVMNNDLKKYIKELP